MKKLTVIAALFLFFVLGACQALGDDQNTESTPFPTPTIHPFFANPRDTVTTPPDSAAGATPTVADLFSAEQTSPSPTTLATDASPQTPPATTTLSVTTTPTATVTPAAAQTISVTVYDETVDPNWTVANSSETMSFTLRAESPTFDGDYAIAMTPQEDFSQLYFSVRPGARETYPYDRVLGVTFWLNGGEELVDLDDLAMTIVGSNQYPYWVAGDDSVENAYDPIFSETRLYYLGLNRSLPPETWVQVTNWLDDREFDPVYEYVTGFYLKSDEGFRNTLYLDRIELIMLAEDPAAE